MSASQFLHRYYSALLKSTITERRLIRLTSLGILLYAVPQRLTNESNAPISKELDPDISQKIRPERPLTLLSMFEYGYQLCKEHRYCNVQETGEQDEKDADDLSE